MKKHLVLVVFLFSNFLISQAQTTVTLGTGTTASSIGVITNMQGARPYTSRQKSIYTYNELTAAGGGLGFISKIRWYKSNNGNYPTPNGIFRIYLYQTNQLEFPNSSEDWISSANHTPIKKVFETTTASFDQTIGWVEFTLDSFYNVQKYSSIVVMSEFVQFSAPGSFAPSWQYTSFLRQHCFSGKAANTGDDYMLTDASRPNIQFVMFPNCPIKVNIPQPSIYRCSTDTPSISVQNPQVGYTYTWRPSLGLNTTTGTTVQASPGSSTIYYVRAFNGSPSCYTEDTVTVYTESTNDLVATLTSCACLSKSTNNIISVPIKYSSANLKWQKRVTNVWIDETNASSTTINFSPPAGPSSFYRVKMTTPSCVFYSNAVRTTDFNFIPSTVSIGNNQEDDTYLSLTKPSGFFDAINCVGLSTNVEAIIKENLQNENGEIDLIDKNNGYSIVIKNDTASRIIKGSSENCLIGLNGIDSLSFDGGINNGLTFINEGNGNIVNFTNASNYNQLKNCVLQAGSTFLSNTVIAFGYGNNNSGNNYNEIIGCKITRRFGSYINNGIYSLGNNNNMNLMNRYNKISNNYFYDIYTPTGGGKSIKLTDGNSNWTITDNHIYLSNTLSLTSAVFIEGINITSNSAENMVVSGNYIGGNSPNAQGLWKYISAGSLHNFTGIYLAVLSATCSNNVIRNFSITSSNVKSQSSNFTGIFLSGNMNVNVKNNLIGDLNNNSSIYINIGAQEEPDIIGIWSDGAKGTFSKNTISGFNVISTSSFAPGVYGIFTGTTQFGKLTIDSNNIFNFRTATRGETALIAVNGSSTYSTIISNNTINNILAEKLELTGLKGIYKTGNGPLTISKNKISNLITESYLAPGNYFAVNIGIYSSSADTTQKIEFNEIHHLFAKLKGTNLQQSIVLIGIGINNASGKVYANSNKINNLENLSTYLSEIRGFSITASKRITLVNNVVSLKSDSNLNNITIHGINDNISANSSSFYYHNTILIDASTTSMSNLKSSIAYLRNFNSLSTHKNNMYINRRHFGAGWQYAFSGVTTNLIADHNIYYSLDSTKTFMFNFNGITVTSFNGWKAFRGNNINADGHSIFSNTEFISSSDLYPTTNNCKLNDKGTKLSSVQLDFNNVVRANIPDIGAYEFIGDQQTIELIGSKNNLECGTGDSIRLTIDSLGANSIKWYRNNILLSGYNNDTIYVKESGNFHVEIPELICNSTSNTFTINRIPRSENILGVDTYICNGSSKLLNAGYPGSKYFWNTGDTTQTISITDSGKYTVFIKTINCDVVDTINIKKESIPQVHLGFDTSYCTNIQITLNAGNVGSTYLWNTGDTSQTIEVSQSGVYSVRVENSKGCFGYDSIQINKLPLPIVNLGNDSILCGGTLNYLLEVGNSIYTYLWNTGDSSHNLLITTPGTYSVQVFANNGCTSYDTIQFSQSNNPISNFSILQQGANQVTFFSIPQTNVQFLWDFGDGFTDTSHNPIHTYQTSGNYIITLWCIDTISQCASNSVDTISIFLGLNETSHLFQLSAYPNPIEDQLTISLELFDETELQIDIYDLLGNKIQTIVDQKTQKGNHFFEWDASLFKPGVYYLKVKVDDQLFVKKIMRIE